MSAKNKYIIAFFSIIAAMIIYTIIFINADSHLAKWTESDQAWIIPIGILAGLGFFVSQELWDESKKEKEAKKEQEKKEKAEREALILAEKIEKEERERNNLRIKHEIEIIEKEIEDMISIQKQEEEKDRKDDLFREECHAKLANDPQYIKYWQDPLWIRSHEKLDREIQEERQRKKDVFEKNIQALREQIRVLQKQITES